MEVVLPEPGSRDLRMMRERIALADEMLAACRLCERRCGVDRRAGELGACGCTAESTVYQEGLLWGEERFITPSYALYFAGCNLRCAFCYAGAMNASPAAYPLVEPAAVAGRVQECRTPAVSFSFIGGEPSVHLHTALRVAAALPPRMPLVWNSNFLFSGEAAGLLEGVADVFIADLHFGNDECARALAGAERYLDTVRRNAIWASRSGVLVLRHLVVPGHVECCTGPTLRWIAAELPTAPVHLLANYLPPPARLMGELSRTLTETEEEEALGLVAELGLRAVT